MYDTSARGLSAVQRGGNLCRQSVLLYSRFCRRQGSLAEQRGGEVSVKCYEKSSNQLLCGLCGEFIGKESGSVALRDKYLADIHRLKDTLVGGI